MNILKHLGLFNFYIVIAIFFFSIFEYFIHYSAPSLFSENYETLVYCLRSNPYLIIVFIPITIFAIYGKSSLNKLVDKDLDYSRISTIHNNFVSEKMDSDNDYKLEIDNLKAELKDCNNENMKITSLEMEVTALKYQIDDLKSIIELCKEKENNNEFLRNSLESAYNKTNNALYHLATVKGLAISIANQYPENHTAIELESMLRDIKLSKNIDSEIIIDNSEDIETDIENADFTC